MFCKDISKHNSFLCQKVTQTTTRTRTKQTASPQAKTKGAAAALLLSPGGGGGGFPLFCELFPSPRPADLHSPARSGAEAVTLSQAYTVL